MTSANGDRQGVRLNESEMWIDTLFMTVLFLNKMGQKYQNEEWIMRGYIRCSCTSNISMRRRPDCSITDGPLQTETTILAVSSGAAGQQLVYSGDPGLCRDVQGDAEPGSEDDHYRYIQSTGKSAEKASGSQRSVAHLCWMMPTATRKYPAPLPLHAVS